MPKGIVVSFERNTGYGFIEAEDGQSLFVHHTAIADTGREYLVAGQHVEFSIALTERGPRAEAVKVVRDVPPKRQRKLDWRHRRGGRPRSGTVPKQARRLAGGEPDVAEEAEEEEGVLRSRRPAPGKPDAG